MKKTLLISILALLGMTQAVAQEYEYVPVVREGVKWVNEKVIINQGDTICYYYNYEFQGMDDMAPLGSCFNACYYYEGDHLNVETDSLIAGLDGITCFRNNPLDLLVDQGKMMFHFLMMTDGGTRILYPWGEGLIDYYLYCQDISIGLYGCVNVLTKENFTEVEPIKVEDTTCRRYAYVKEDGDTMCYVVEGIGFDSRNMGDLLTPFTREPDPDTDYQEYCGLCHVVKDGQIIYKGMRYDPGNMTGIEQARQVDDNYYNLMGQPMGKTLPTTPGIYIHHGNKICVSRTP